MFIDLDARTAVVLRADNPDVPKIAPADATLRFEAPGGGVEIDLSEVFGDAGGA